MAGSATPDAPGIVLVYWTDSMKLVVSPAAVELLRQILGGRLAQALDEPASPATHEVEHLATRVVEHHLERRLRSVGVLE